MIRVVIAATACAVALPAAAQTPSAAFVAGRQALRAGQLDAAETQLRNALAAKPDDYLTLYNFGLVFEQRSRQAANPAARLDLLRTSADWLEKARAHLPTGPGTDYTIYNTLGFVYIQLGDLSRAEVRLNEGMGFINQLNPVSRGKLQANIGYVRALRGDNNGAARSFDLAARNGNAAAAANLSKLKSAH